jgi:hypothetical protein
MSFRVPEKFRITKGDFATSALDGNNGAFEWGTINGPIRTIASDGGEKGNEWEHVSVSFERRCPTWEEMCRVKNLFWDENDCVLQYHPPKSDYVNNHKFCLHLWRPVNIIMPRPPSWMVGIK